MRPSLLPGPARRGAAQSRPRRRGVRLFEIGRRYLRGEADERRAADARRGAGGRESAARLGSRGKARAFDAFDAKAEALALLAEAGRAGRQAAGDGRGGPQFHPGQSATLRLGPKTVLARFGALHPATLAAFDVDGPVVAAELFLDAIPARRAPASPARAYAPPRAAGGDARLRVPRRRRRCPPATCCARSGAPTRPNIVDARIFDVFRGAGRARRARSRSAIEVTLQPGEKSYHRRRAQGDRRSGCRRRGGEAGRRVAWLERRPRRRPPALARSVAPAPAQRRRLRHGGRRPSRGSSQALAEWQARPKPASLETGARAAVPRWSRLTRPVHLLRSQQGDLGRACAAAARRDGDLSRWRRSTGWPDLVRQRRGQAIFCDEPAFGLARGGGRRGSSGSSG